MKADGAAGQIEIASQFDGGNIELLEVDGAEARLAIRKDR